MAPARRYFRRGKCGSNAGLVRRDCIAIGAEYLLPPSSLWRSDDCHSSAKSYIPCFHGDELRCCHWRRARIFFCWRLSRGLFMDFRYRQTPVAQAGGRDRRMDDMPVARASYSYLNQVLYLIIHRPLTLACCGRQTTCAVSFVDRRGCGDARADCNVGDGSAYVVLIAIVLRVSRRAVRRISDAFICVRSVAHRGFLSGRIPGPSATFLFHWPLSILSGP